MDSGYKFYYITHYKQHKLCKILELCYACNKVKENYK